MFTQFTQNLNRCTLATTYTHPHIVPNYVLMNIKEVSVFFSVAIKWKSMVKVTAWLQVLFKISSFVLRRKEKSVRFGTTRGWINDTRIKNFGMFNKKCLMVCVTRFNHILGPIYAETNSKHQGSHTFSCISKFNKRHFQ